MKIQISFVVGLAVLGIATLAPFSIATAQEARESFFRSRSREGTSPAPQIKPPTSIQESITEGPGAVVPQISIIPDPLGFGCNKPMGFVEINMKELNIHYFSAYAPENDPNIKYKIIGTDGNDCIVGGNMPDLIDGGDGDDKLVGGHICTDTVSGGRGDDVGYLKTKDFRDNIEVQQTFLPPDMPASGWDEGCIK